MSSGTREDERERAEMEIERAHAGPYEAGDPYADLDRAAVG